MDVVISVLQWGVMPEEAISLENRADRLNEETLIRRIRDGEHELF